MWGLLASNGQFGILGGRGTRQTRLGVHGNVGSESAQEGASTHQRQQYPTFHRLPLTVSVVQRSTSRTGPGHQIASGDADRPSATLHNGSCDSHVTVQPKTQPKTGTASVDDERRGMQALVIKTVSKVVPSVRDAPTVHASAATFSSNAASCTETRSLLHGPHHHHPSLPPPFPHTTTTRLREVCEHAISWLSLAVDLGWLMVDGAAKRRRQRCLRSWLRHEQQTVAAVLATVSRHSYSKVDTAHDGLRALRTVTSTRRAQKPPLPGKRPGLPPEPEPQGGAVTDGTWLP